MVCKWVSLLKVFKKSSDIGSEKPRGSRSMLLTQQRASKPTKPPLKYGVLGTFCPPRALILSNQLSKPEVSLHISSNISCNLFNMFICAKPLLKFQAALVWSSLVVKSCTTPSRVSEAPLRRCFRTACVGPRSSL